MARKFLEFVEGYERLMEKHVPEAYEVYTSLGNGKRERYRRSAPYCYYLALFIQIAIALDRPQGQNTYCGTFSCI